MSAADHAGDDGPRGRLARQIGPPGGSAPGDAVVGGQRRLAHECRAGEQHATRSRRPRRRRARRASRQVPRQLRDLEDVDAHVEPAEVAAGEPRDLAPSGRVGERPRTAPASASGRAHTERGRAGSAPRSENSTSARTTSGCERTAADVAGRSSAARARARRRPPARQPQRVRRRAAAPARPARRAPPCRASNNHASRAWPPPGVM